MDDKAIARLPAKPLPTTMDAWAAARKTKTDRTLNDHVEDAHLALLSHNDEKRREKYTHLLEAVWDEEAVEGSLSADNLLSAMMIREYATEEIGENVIRDTVLRTKKLATIVKALSVVLRRYENSRKQRRNTVAGETVPNGDNE